MFTEDSLSTAHLKQSLSKNAYIVVCLKQFVKFQVILLPGKLKQ